ncbi:MAG: SO_0444 family Cu/Zn efflux transporter [Kangiellaceae bacterium]
MTNFIINFAELFTESAPWLLLGLLIAGFMKWIVPMELLQKHMGDNRFSSILKATLIGAPLPLCSCGVIPAAIGLKRSGASKSTTVSFLIATPETGVDSISVSYALLGPFFAIIRPLSAIFTAIYAGLLVKFFAINDKTIPNFAEKQKLESEKQNNNCCASKAQEKQPAQMRPTELLVQSLKFSSGKLLSDITKWLLIGLLLAAAIKTWVSTDFLTQWGDGFVAMLVMALIGVPMYICATASTPLAAGFLAAGLSPGAILVFMLAGPATNIATMGMIKQEMGSKVLVAYLFSLFSASIGIGYFANWLVEQWQIIIPTIAAPEHEMTFSPVYSISAILLVILIIRNLLPSKSTS